MQSRSSPIELRLAKVQKVNHMSGRPAEEVDTQPGVISRAKLGFGNSAWSTVRSASRNSGGPELGPGADLPGGGGLRLPRVHL